MLKQSRLDDVGKLTLRLMVGILILLHGAHKLLHPDALGSIRGMLGSVGLPSLLAYGVYLGEVGGALMVILGIYSRLGGFLIAGNMLFAIGLAHMGQLFTLTKSGGWGIELQALFLFPALAIALLGPGRFSLQSPGSRWN